MKKPESILSAKNRLLIPKEAREALGVKTGDKLLIVVRGSGVIVLRKPELPHVSIRGLAKGTYPDEYLEEERRGWE